ncbi:MAG: dephospho-CoA kinase [Leptothrix sp. (in: b-proteobacteria)]
MPAAVRRIGLTGGIGSGKSTVAAMLAELGAVVIDTDAIAHALTAPGGAAIEAIAQRLGAELIAPDGALDRAAMRARIVADPAVKAALEQVLHPLIGALTEARAAAAPADRVRVFDVPLLVESGRWRDRVDSVLVVDCAAETQVARVVARSGWPAEQVRQVIALQASRGARRDAADAVIVNDGLSLAALRAEVEAIWRRWVGPVNVPLAAPLADSVADPAARRPAAG